MDFVTLYGTELDRELGSADRTELFTTARRKAAINAGQQEWLELTECLTRETTVSLSDGTQEYDLEASITDLGWISKQGVSIKIVTASQTRYIEGEDLVRTTVQRLNTEEPGWRAIAASTPAKVYLRRDGGAVYLGFHPKPDVAAGETWTAIVPYVVVPSDLSADADEPFTVASNPIKSLRPYHRALVHFAAADLEKLRGRHDATAAQLEVFGSYVTRYLGRERPRQGQTVRLAKNYRRPALRSAVDDDLRVFPT